MSSTNPAPAPAPASQGTQQQSPDPKVLADQAAADRAAAQALADKTAADRAAAQALADKTAADRAAAEQAASSAQEALARMEALQKAAAPAAAAPAPAAAAPAVKRPSDALEMGKKYLFASTIGRLQDPTTQVWFGEDGPKLTEFNPWLKMQMDADHQRITVVEQE